MRVLGHTGHGSEHVWPDAGETLMLRAALGPPDVARAAWDEWYASTDIEALDYDAHRLFPLIYRRLVELGVDSPELPRLKGVYRHYWYGNQLLLRDAAIAIRALGDNGVETLVLKGLGLTARHYRDGGTRPMYDVDVLVRPDDVARALEVIGEIGFRPYGTRPLDLQLRSRYGIGLHNDAGRELDLHWYATFQSAGDDDFWSASVPVEIAGVQTRVLCPADQLLHVCVHGLSGASPAPLRWIADALTVIRSSGDELDWNRLVERAVARECTVTLAGGLSCLEREFQPGIPVDVIERLRAAPSSLAERWAHRVVARGQRHGAFYALNWHRYRRLRAARAPGVQPNFLAYLCDCWDVSGYGELGRLVASKAVDVARHGHSVAAELGPDEMKQKPSPAPNGAGPL